MEPLYSKLPKMRTTSVIRIVYLVPMMSGIWTFYYIYRLYRYLQGFMLFRSQRKSPRDAWIPTNRCITSINYIHRYLNCIHRHLKHIHSQITDKFCHQEVNSQCTKFETFFHYTNKALYKVNPGWYYEPGFVYIPH